MYKEYINMICTYIYIYIYSIYIYIRIYIYIYIFSTPSPPITSFPMKNIPIETETTLEMGAGNSLLFSQLLKRRLLKC